MANSPFLRAFSPLGKQPDDAKWRTYASNVEQSMKGWETIRVWADYVYYLQKLGKALRTNPGKSQTIPHARLVAQRLSECLQPHISSGVHAKAIDVYNVVFDLLGDKLPDEIALWFPGMSRLLSQTDTTTMHPVANLFRRLIDAMPDLRALMKPLLMGLLAGLEDESSEIFNTVFKMVDDVKLKVNDDAHFWQCFFLTVISSPERRLGALAYANRRFPKFSCKTTTTQEDEKTDNDTKAPRNRAYQQLDYEAQMAINPDPGLLVRAFCTGLQDDALLVQRGFMELLVQNLELSSVALQIIADKKDLQRLCLAACSTVLKREMSLNRRLWTWLLGPDPEPSEDTRLARSSYFTKYAQDHLVNGLLGLVNAPTNDPGTRTKPYRICVSILDRWEIGGSVIPRVFIPAMRSVKEFSDNYPDLYQEIIASAGGFFDATETINIGHDLLQLVLSLENSNIELLEFVLDNFHVADNELRERHLPLILLALLVKREEIEDAALWFRCCEKIVEVFPDFTDSTEGSSSDNSFAVKYKRIAYSDEWLSKINSFYSAANETDAEAGTGPFAVADLINMILSQLSTLATSNMTDHYYSLLADFLVKVPIEGQWRDDDLVQTMVDSGKGVKLFGLVSHGMSNLEIDKFVSSLLGRVWGLLSLPNSAYPVESVRAVWDIQESLDDLRIESSLASLFLAKNEDPIDQMRAFTRLWTHSIDRANYMAILSRLTFLVLDNLHDENWSVLIQTWLENVTMQRSSVKLFNILVQPIIDTPHQTDVLLFKYHIDALSSVLIANDKLRQCYFRDQLNGVSIEKTVSNVLMDYLVTDVPSIALPSCIKLIDHTLIDHANMIQVLMHLLTKFQKADMEQIPVLKLLSKCLQRYAATKPDHTTLGDDLKQCLIDGLSAPVSNEFTVETWVRLLCDSLPLFDSTILQHLIQMSGCLCNQVVSVFENVQLGHNEKSFEIITPMVSTSLYSFVDGLEKLLVSAHEKLQYEERRASVPGPTQHHPTPPNQIGGFNGHYGSNYGGGSTGSGGHHSNASIGTGGGASGGSISGETGFFGNVISGVFAVESPIAKSQAANTRLTVLLAFQDAIKIAFDIWKWTETVGWSDSSESDILLCSRLKTRMRRFLIRLYNLEPLETCERLIQLGLENTKQVCKLIHVIDGGRPKYTLPHLFSSLTTRINADSPHQTVSSDVYRSSMTTDLTEQELSKFLTDYLSSVENDAMEEIWPECIGFVTREVLPNHSLYKPVIHDVLSMARIMGEKVSRIKFGDSRKVKKELSESFMRLLNHALNAKSQVPDFGATSSGSASTHSLGLEKEDEIKQDLLVQSLIQLVPKVKVLQDTMEKQFSTMTVIMNNLIMPRFRTKQFPASFDPQTVELLATIINVPDITKSWKSNVAEIIFEQRFMAMPSKQAQQWKPIVSRWAQFDKDRVKDYVYRLSSHGAGNSFINWSDSETVDRQINLKRLAFLFLCGPDTGYGLDIPEVLARFEELISTDNQVVGHVCLVLRSMVLAIDRIHLRPIWTLISNLLISIFSRMLDTGKDLDLATLVHGCKLLDVLLCVGYEDFRLHEWLFICDNMDAIFRADSASRQSSGMIIDLISSSGALPPISETSTAINLAIDGKKQPLLVGVEIASLSQLKPFFDRLSMTTYEQLYSLNEPDLDVCKDDLVDDLFDRRGKL